jgi:sensor histidine kinase regulating citrate/malate metabolism
MKKDKLYLYNFITISFIVFSFGYFATSLLLKQSINQLLQLQIDASKRETEEIAKFISSQIEESNKQTLIKNIQKSIENSNNITSFISLINWSGIEISHPDPNKIGEKTKWKNHIRSNKYSSC